MAEPKNQMVQMLNALAPKGEGEMDREFQIFYHECPSSTTIIVKCRTMATPTDQIMQMLYALAAKEQLEVEETGAGQRMVMVVASFLGLSVGGGGGLVAGLVVGAVIVALLGGSSKRLSDFLKEMTTDMKEKLCAGVWKLIEDGFWFCVDAMIERVLGDTKLKNKIVEFLRSYFKSSLNKKIK